MISYLATAALLVTGVVSQTSVTSYTTCMTCVSVEGSWNLSTKKCETRNYDSSYVNFGSGCYKNNNCLFDILLPGAARGSIELACGSC